LLSSYWENEFPATRIRFLKGKAVTKIRKKDCCTEWWQPAIPGGTKTTITTTTTTRRRAATATNPATISTAAKAILQLQKRLRPDYIF
jgi:hypothetical protein